MNKAEFSRLVGRVRGHFGSHISRNKESYKTSAAAAGTGGAAAFAREHFTKDVEFFQSHWWAEGAAMAAGGHFLAKKNRAAGHALLGVGGFLLAESYMATQTQAGGGTASKTRANAAGLDDASDDASALVNSAFTSLPEASALIDVSGLRDTAFTSDVSRSRSEASAILEASGDADASDALDL